MTGRPVLRALADRLGILPNYQDVEGHPHETLDSTREALATAMGCDTSTEESAARALVLLDEAATPGLPEGPDSCLTIDELLGDARLTGTCVFLSTIGGTRNWGAGDFTDLAELAEESARDGAGFIGLNPLHAVRHRGNEVSPYSPISRLFRDALYLDVEAVPGYSTCEEALALADSTELRAELASLRSGPRVRQEAADASEAPVLEALHRSTRVTHSPVDPLLESFAIFCAIDELHAGLGDWHAWPVELRDPAGDGVAAFGREHADRVAFHAWLQVELDRQLGEAARRARSAGMPLGLFQDLALGSAGNGFDPWHFRRLFVEGVSVGAPPDPLAPGGQDWGFPPLDPRQLAATDFDFYARVLRTSFAHSGALRLDHVLGLVRQFWIPHGSPASEGAYVRQPLQSLCRIIARESRDAHAIVVGEDLGTLPPELPEVLARWGILSTRVLYFQRDHQGAYLPSDAWPRHALASATTHDLPPLAGWWEGRDVMLRRELGMIGTEQDLITTLHHRERDRALLLRRLHSEGIDADESSPESVRDAVHAFLRKTPSRLVGFWLDDLLGEREPLNIPGIGQERHESWTRRLTRL